MSPSRSRRCSRVVALLVLSAAGAAMTLAACSNEVTRRDVAASLTKLVIVPRYEAAAAYARALDSRVGALVEDPSDARLEEARAAWRDARSAWSRVQAYTFGPVMELRITPLVSWWPISEEKIETALGRDAISAQDVRESFAADQRGFSALERLLFNDDDLVLQGLMSGSGTYGQYLSALASVIAEAIGQASQDWSGEYGEAFSGSGDRAVSENLAIADIVRVPVFLTETVGDMQLGAALGITKTEADPTVIPEGNAGAALDDLEQHLRSIQDTYLGDPDGLGVSDLIAQLSEETDGRMRGALSDAIKSIETLKSRGQTLNELTQTDPDALAEVREAIKSVQIVLNTEVVSLLGVTIGFSDNDGDS